MTPEEDKILEKYIEAFNLGYQQGVKEGKQYKITAPNNNKKEIKMNGQQQSLTFKEKVDYIRRNIKDIAQYLDLEKKRHQNEETNGVENVGEVMANLTLAYRHLEDASMRMGKVLQAYDGGISVYDKETTVGS